MSYPDGKQDQLWYKDGELMSDENMPLDDDDTALTKIDANIEEVKLF
jgi:hypothetical protein